MDVDIPTENVNECVALVPIGVYTRETDTKKKFFYNIIKRMIDIIVGICGLIFLIPIIMRNICSANDF